MAGVHYSTLTGGLYSRGPLFESLSEEIFGSLCSGNISLVRERECCWNCVSSAWFSVTSDIYAIYKYSSHYHFFQHLRNVKMCKSHHVVIIFDDSIKQCIKPFSLVYCSYLLA